MHPDFNKIGSELHLDVSGQQKPALHGLDMSLPQRPELHLDMSSSVSTSEAFAAFGLQLSRGLSCNWTRGTTAWSGHVIVYPKALSCTWICLANRSLCWSEHVYSTGPELHLDVSILQRPMDLLAK
jgi:hypothetical protein